MGLSSNNVFLLATTRNDFIRYNQKIYKYKKTLHLVNFSNLAAVFVICLLISAAIMENSERAWGAFFFKDGCEGSGDDKSALLSKIVFGVCVRVRRRSHMEWNSLVLSLKDVVIVSYIEKKKKKERENISLSPFLLRSL